MFQYAIIPYLGLLIFLQYNTMYNKSFIFFINPTCSYTGVHAFNSIDEGWSLHVKIICFKLSLKLIVCNSSTLCSCLEWGSYV